jgi:ParB/RepB/Spo0J family partition protein
MARRGGLKTNPLEEMAKQAQVDEENVVADLVNAGATDEALDINEVAPDPENPESRLEVDEVWIASFKVSGQLTPGVVLPKELWANAYGYDLNNLPESVAEKMPAEAKYVIWYGHKRWAGAKGAGHSTYKAFVHTAPVDRLKIRLDRLTENLVREAVSPWDEAEQFRRIITEDKISGRELARRLGIHQSHISRRIGLFDLPDDAQAALSAELITFEHAEELQPMKSEPKRIKRAIDRITREANDAKNRPTPEEPPSPLNAIRAEKRAFEAAKAALRTRKRLEADGVTVIDSVSETFGVNAWKHRLNGTESVAAQEQGTPLVATVTDDGLVTWYLKELPSDPEPEPQSEPGTTAEPTSHATAAGADNTPGPGTVSAPPPSPAAPAETDEERAARLVREKEARARDEARAKEAAERAAAVDARDAACQRIAGKAPNRDHVAARLAARVLAGEDTYDDEAEALAARWLHAAGILTDPGTDLYNLPEGTDQKTTVRVAYVLDLAINEARVRESLSWDQADRDHIARLQEEGAYVLTEYDQRQITPND